MSTDPKKPTRQQARAEERLRDLGVTVTFAPSTAVPHTHTEPVRGCLRCTLIESAARVNEVTR